MQLSRPAKLIAFIAAAIMTAGFFTCLANMPDNEEGQPLSELDLSGPPPQNLTAAGADEVRISMGDKFEINVAGNPEAKDQVLFILADNMLTIKRKEKFFFQREKKAIIHVTTPVLLQEVMVVGAGKVSAPQLANEAKIIIAGSGQLETSQISSKTMELVISGAGSYLGAGHVDTMDIKITGSGTAAMETLKVEEAYVTMTGAGSASFASDGKVKAIMIGVGTVHVKGEARCSVQAMGAGKLICDNAF